MGARKIKKKSISKKPAKKAAVRPSAKNLISATNAGN